jgi:3-isopropylmalate/(R)-2-methylmalate dehydratase large subunit
MNQSQTIIDKLWAAHEILRREDGDSLLWVDRHYVHLNPEACKVRGPG